ncbi:MAG: DNA mismatch repair protein MutS [Bacteroidales bacterium]|nr:DNA mismatch repair protein MutS [Bacteroidales bacterium]MDY0217584.1 DNA mismatch repair protein MutS [Bacteroidales bacterium]
MILIKNIQSQNRAFAFIIESMDLKTTMGRHYMLNFKYLRRSSEIQNELDMVDLFYQAQQNDNKREIIERILIKLDHVMDIRGSVKRISASMVLDDVELFEIKRFSLLINEINALLESLQLNYPSMPCLQKVVDVLDPDKQRIATFYIYSSYDSELAKYRKLAKETEDSELREKYNQQALELEDKVRIRICEQLMDHKEALNSCLDEIAILDFVLAKTLLAFRLNLKKPIIKKGQTSYKGLFNPYVKEILEKEGKSFQEIDIELFQKPCLLTGVNMGGKTVLLKTLGLAQYLFQFGFFVPAEKAEISPVDLIFISSGDHQSELAGLSSYAAEMLVVNDIIKAAKSNKRILAIIDELARTTNPAEGQAIVNAALEIFSENHVMALVSTHYGGLSFSGRRLKIKGLSFDALKDKTIDIKRIQQVMDYSVVEDDGKENVHQAIEIASLLGVDKDLLYRADKFLKDN